MDDKRLCILFVEDVPLDAELAQHALEKEGLTFDSMLVDTPDAFVAALEKFCPDVIISDYVMPAFDGMRALGLALAHNPHLPFIVFTASQNEETAVACIKAGATDYVLKDRLARLPFAVKEALEQDRVRQEKQEAEQALRESEERYRTLFEQAGDYVLVMDIDPSGNLIIVDANEAALRAHGYMREELLGKPISIIAPSISPDMVEEQMRLLDSGAPLLFTTTHRRNDGSWFDVEIHATLVSMSAKKMILSIERDITARTRAECALQEQRDLLATIFDCSPSILMLVDEEGRVEKINRAGADFANRPAEELINWLAGEVFKCVNAFRGNECGKNTACATCPVRTRMKKTFETGQPSFNESARLMAWKDGREIPIDFLISTSQVDTSYGKRVMVTFTDISVLKRAEEQVRESEERFATIFRASPMSIALTRLKDSKLIDVNETWEKLTGWTQDQVIGRTRRELNLWVDSQEEDRLIEELLAKRQVRDFDVQIRRKSGEVADLFVSAELIELTGEPCMLSIALDVTERKRTEEALQSSELRYRSLFENVAVPIWEEDFSKVKRYVNGLGIQNLRAYFDAHPDELAYCASLIKVISVNQESLRIFRANHEDEIMRHQVSDYFVDESWRVFKDEILVLLEGKMRFESELPFLDFTGKIRQSLLRLSVVPGFEHSLGRVLVSFIDITERKEMEERLSALSRRLFEAQEAERRNVARELHDEIGQVLTAVKSNLQTSKLLTDPELSANFLDESIGIVDQALQQVRDLSLNLRPSLLDDFGLVPALEWYLNRQAHRSNFTAEFAIVPREIQVPQTLATTCFRVAQTALTNVERHAHAKHVRVELYLQHTRTTARDKKSELQLVIRDDGVGFDSVSALEAARRGATLGLVGMQERVWLAGGDMEIHSQPGHGTEIIARFPIVQPHVERRSKRRLA